MLRLDGLSSWKPVIISRHCLGRSVRQAKSTRPAPNRVLSIADGITAGRQAQPISEIDTCQYYHASNAGSRRPFRPPDPFLEPQDGPVHLRPSQQDPHHQPREDARQVQRGDEVRHASWRPRRAPSCSSAPSARRARSSPRKPSAAGMPYVDQRWLGGMLTNFKTVKQSIKRLKDMEADGRGRHLREACRRRKR